MPDPDQMLYHPAIFVINHWFAQLPDLSHICAQLLCCSRRGACKIWGNIPYCTLTSLPFLGTLVLRDLLYCSASNVKVVVEDMRNYLNIRCVPRRQIESLYMIELTK